MGHAHTHTHTYKLEGKAGWLFGKMMWGLFLGIQWERCGARSGHPTGSWPPGHTHPMYTRSFTRRLTQDGLVGRSSTVIQSLQKGDFPKASALERIRKTRTDVHGKFSWGVESSCTVSPSSFRNGLKHWSSKGTSLHHTLRDTQEKCAHTRNMLVGKTELSSFIHFSYAFSKACALCSYPEYSCLPRFTFMELKRDNKDVSKINKFFDVVLYCYKKKKLKL